MHAGPIQPGGAEAKAPAFESDAYASRHLFELVPGRDPNGWLFVIEPYGWLPGLNGEASIKGFPAINFDVTPKTLLEHFEWGVFLKGEVRRGRWGLLADGFFTELSADGDPPGPLYSSATITIQQGLFEMALAYRVWEDPRAFLDVYAGARLNYFSLALSADVDSESINQIGDDAGRRINDNLARVTDAAAARQAANFQARLDANLQRIAQLDETQIAELQAQIQRNINQDSAAAIRRIEQLQTQLTAKLQQTVNAGVAQVDGLKTQVADDVRKDVDTDLVERWAVIPKEVRRLEDREDVHRALNPVHREFVELVQTQAQLQVTSAKNQIAVSLQSVIVATAEQQVADATKVLRQTLKSDEKSAKVAARQSLATANQDLAAAQSQLDAVEARAESDRSAGSKELDGKVKKAQAKLAKSISRDLEDDLPTDAGGERWWVDPIIGVRGQVNLTRWLFLAVKCDAGGFYAGSRIAWNLNGSIGVNFTRNIFAELGYRYYYLDYDNAGLLYKTAEKGIFSGIGVKF